METKLCPIVGVVLCVLSDERAQGDGVLKKVLYGGLRRKIQLTLLYIIFDRKCTPFVYSGTSL